MMKDKIKNTLISLCSYKSIQDFNYDICEPLSLATELMNYYPIYGSDAQLLSQSKLKKYLDRNGWKTYLDYFTYSDIKDEKYVKKPWRYHNFYSDYKSKKRVNLYAIFDSGKPGNTILLNGHIDVDIIDFDVKKNTVFIKGSRLYGRGASDMIVGLCLYTFVSNILKDINWGGRIIFTSVVDEEIGGNGSIRCRQWLRSHNLVDSGTQCFIGEPSNNKMCNATFGMLPFKLTIYNTINHMNAQCGPSTINILYEIINKLENKLRKHKGFNYNIGLINGGVDASLPIPKLTTHGSFTLPHNLRVDEMKLIFNKICNSYKYELEYNDLQIEPYLNNHGINDEIEIFRSACDASIFSSFDFPIFIWGPGKLEQAHSKNEYIDFSDIIEFCNVFFPHIEKLMKI